MTYIAPGEGYQIKVKDDQSATWRLKGKPFSGTLEMSLIGGWNLIGNPFQKDLTKEEFFGDKLDFITRIIQPETQEDIPIESFDVIPSGKSFWFYYNPTQLDSFDPLKVTPIDLEIMID